MKMAKKRLIKGVLLLGVLSVAVAAFSLEGRNLGSMLPSDFSHLSDTFAFSHGKARSSANAVSADKVTAVGAAPAIPGPATPAHDMSFVQSLDVSQVAVARMPLLSSLGVAAGHYTIWGQWVPTEQSWLGGHTDLLASGRFGVPAAGVTIGRNDGGTSFEGLQLASSAMRDLPMVAMSDPGNGWQSAFYGDSNGQSNRGGSAGSSDNNSNTTRGGSVGGEALSTPMDPPPIRVAVSVVPEPSTYALMGAALLCLFFLRRRRPLPF